MAKFYGMVGFGESVEQPPDSGVWVDEIVEYPHRGDVIRHARTLESSDQANYNLSVSNSISLVANAYSRQHFHAIRYVRWSGVCWVVTEVTVEPPRLILRLGGVYDGPTPA